MKLVWLARLSALPPLISPSYCLSPIEKARGYVYLCYAQGYMAAQRRVDGDALLDLVHLSSRAVLQ